MIKKISTTVFFILFLMITQCFARQTILVIESYHAQYAWDISYKKGIEKILGQTYNLIYFQMDTKRLPKEQFEKKADQAYAMVETTDPILVMLCDDNALRLVGPHLANSDIPVVYLGINNNPRDYWPARSENFTGVLERPLAKRSIVYLGELIKPELKKVLILYDSGITSKASVNEMFNDQSSVLLGGVRVDLKMITTLSEWKKSVLSAKLKGYGAIVVGLYHTIVDERGLHVKADDIITWTSENTTVPPFGFWDFTVGLDKTVGGLVLFGQTQGEAGGRLALRVLSGIRPNQIPPVTGKKGRFFFSRSQLKKWNITLPEKIALKSTFTD